MVRGQVRSCREEPRGPHAAQPAVRARSRAARFRRAIDQLKPNVLIGATGMAGTFTQQVVERMSAINARPVLFACPIRHRKRNARPNKPMRGAAVR